VTTPPVPGGQTLRIGFVPGVTLTKWSTIWRERFPAVRLELVEVPLAGQRRVLDDQAVDLCFVRLPLDTDGLHLIPLYDEVPVVWVSREHPLAAFDDVTTADLSGEEVLEEADSASIDLVAQEVAVLRVPMSIARSHSRRDLVYKTVTDAASTTVGLAWAVGSDHPWIDEFIGVVRGRTVNSSRSVQDRAGGKEPVRPKPARPPAPGRAPGRSRRLRRR